MGLENPFEKPKKSDPPYRRIIELELRDKHVGKILKISHETGLFPDLGELKKDLKTKVGILLDSIYKE